MVAVVAMTACAKEDIVREAPRQAIGFGELFVDNATRAVDNSYSSSNLPASFKVYGTVTGNTTPANTLNIFNGVEVFQSSEGHEIGTENNWWYDQEYVQYWIAGATYNFAAVVGATVGATDKDANGMPTKLNTVADTNMHFQDMLYDVTPVTGVTKNYNTPVAFDFQHLLSKVMFTVNSTATGNYKHSVTNITVSNYTSGTYDIASKSWSGTAGNVSFGKIENVTATSTDAQKTSAFEKLLIPTTASFTVSFTVTTYNGNTPMGTENVGPITITQDLEAANAYNFIINCEVGAPITFTFNSVGGWGTEQDITVQ